MGTCQSEPVAVNVQVNIIPNFEIIVTCDGTKFILDIVSDSDELSLNSNTISLVGPNGFSGNLNIVDSTNLESGDYNAIITNKFGCSVSKSFAEDRTICFLTNLITPCSDGKKDRFNVEDFNVLELEIFNRWGKSIYNRKNYSNQCFGQNNKGEILPDGIYFYLIKTRTENKTGWISVQN